MSESKPHTAAEVAKIAKASGVSVEEMRSRIHEALRASFPPTAAGGCGPYLEAMYQTTIVFSREYDSKSFQIGYTFDPTTMNVALVGAPVEVIRQYVPVGPSAAVAGLAQKIAKAQAVKKILKGESVANTEAAITTGARDNGQRITDAISKAKGCSQQLAKAREARTAKTATPPPANDDEKPPAGAGGVFTKRPVQVRALRLERPAKVGTLEGEMTGKAGDWLITGTKGEQYIVDDAIFRGTYDASDDAARAELTATKKDAGALGDDDLQTGGGALAPDQTTIQATPGKRRKWQGIDLVIDRPAGYVQKGVDAKGNPWSRTYKVDYGYIPGTLGGDGEGLDVFLGPDEAAPSVHWATQSKDDGSFDEYKILFGFEDEEKAVACYKDHIPERYLKSMRSTSVQMLKALLGLEPSEVLKALLADALDRTLKAPALSQPVSMLNPVTLALAEETEPPRSIGREEDASAVINVPATTDVMKSVDVQRFIALGGTVAIKKDSAEIVPDDEIGPRFLLGIVLEPDVVDSQGDTYNAEEIEKTAHDWMARFRNLDLQHKVFINGLAVPVESSIVRSDDGEPIVIGGQSVKMGTWVLGVELVDAGLRAKAKAGAITGFSINGLARRRPIAA